MNAWILGLIKNNSFNQAQWRPVLTIFRSHKGSSKITMGKLMGEFIGELKLQKTVSRFYPSQSQ